MADPTPIRPTATDDDAGEYGDWMHRKFGKSWKTTLAGLLVGGLGVARLVIGFMHHTLTPEDVITGLGMVAGGGGLGVAKDHNATGGTAQ